MPQEDVHIQVLASRSEHCRTVLDVEAVNMVFEAANMGVVDRMQDSDEDLASDC